MTSKSPEYLENKFCKFRVLKDIDYSIKKKLFFLSLFRMKSGGYKSFLKYLNGIKKLNDYANKNNMEVRIFIDNTIYNDEKTMSYLNKMDKVTLVLYECEKFLIGKHHVGLFGTLVRFFPLFYFISKFVNPTVFEGKNIICDPDIINTIFLL